MTTERIALARFIRDIPDWPKKGILFQVGDDALFTICTCL